MARAAKVYIYDGKTNPVLVEATDVSISTSGGGWFVWVGDEKRFYPMAKIDAIYFVTPAPADDWREDNSVTLEIQNGVLGQTATYPV